MKRRSRIGALLAVASALLIISERAAAQSAGTADTLRQQVERRFDILPLHDGIALRPKAARRGVRLIEIADGTIAIDGAPATGGELREKLGADADLVLRLSYLDADARRAIASPRVDVPAAPPPPAAEPPSGAAPVAPAPPAPPRRTR